MGEVVEVLGDDPILVDLLAADFHVARRHGRLKDTDVDLKISKVRTLSV